MTTNGVDARGQLSVDEIEETGRLRCVLRQLIPS